MDYTLTRIDPNGENDRYPLQKQEIVADPLEQQVHCTVYMGKLEHALRDHGELGRKTLFGRITSAFRAVTWRW